MQHNRALEAAGQPALVDHRSYKRQGIDKIPSVHLGPAASQMEKRGIRTDKGEVNRQIAADNKLLKEIKARITRLYNWSKAEAEKPEGQQPSMIDLWEAQQQLKRPDTRTGKIRALQESAALFSFLQANGIQSMQQLHEKIADMNTRYYDLRREIVKAERRIAVLTECGEMWEQYNQYKSIHKQLAKVKPEKREQFEQRHSRELILYDAAENPKGGFGILPDVIFADGGITQIRATKKAIQKYDLNIPVFGMVKNDKHQTRALMDENRKELKISPRLMNLITNFQDTVHDTAITYHRKLRDKAITKSELDEIDGIGKVKKQALLKAFGSVEKIKQASIEDLINVKGINEELAKKIKNMKN